MNYLRAFNEQELVSIFSNEILCLYSQILEQLSKIRLYENLEFMGKRWQVSTIFGHFSPERPLRKISYKTLLHNGMTHLIIIIIIFALMSVFHFERFFMKMFQALLSLAMSLLSFLSFGLLPNTSFHVLLGCPLEKLPLTLIVLLFIRTPKGKFLVAANDTKSLNITIRS